MHDNAEAVPRPVVEEVTACCVCGSAVDLRQLCAVWPDGRIAHYTPCYDRNWMSVGVAGEIASAS